MSAQPEMTGHQCHRCNLHRAVIAELQAEMRQRVRLIETRPGTPLAKAAKARITNIRAEIEEQRRRNAEHLEEFKDDLGRVRKVTGLRPKARPRPKREKKAVVVSIAALSAAKAELDEAAAVGQVPKYVGRGTNIRPATGRCHECDKPVSGERRFCGRCMARRT